MAQKAQIFFCGSLHSNQLIQIDFDFLRDWYEWNNLTYTLSHVLILFTFLPTTEEKIHVWFWWSSKILESSHQSWSESLHTRMGSTWGICKYNFDQSSPISKLKMVGVGVGIGVRLKEYYEIVGESRPLSGFFSPHADLFTEMHL